MRTDNEDFMLALLDYADEFCGSVDDIGYHSLLQGPVTMGDWEHVIHMLAAYQNITVELADELASMAGCIILQNSDGFVYWETYRDQNELERVWSGIEDQYAEFYGEEN